jgi:hypothetical protein
MHIGNSNFFENLEQIVLLDHCTRLLKLEFRLESPLPSYNHLVDFSPSVSFGKTKKKSIAYWDPILQKIIYGFILNAHSSLSLYTCHHFLCLQNNEGIFYLSQCKGCDLFPSISNTNKCIFNIESSKIFKIHFKSEKPVTVTHCLCDSPDELLYALSLFYNTSSTPSPFTMIHSPNIIDTILPPSIYSDHLRTIQSQVKEADALTFYTDGSLDKVRSEDCKIRLGWICIDHHSQYHSFNASLLNWPSSTRAELFAFLTVL